MTTTIKRDTRYDDLDARRLAELFVSPAWRLYSARVAAEVARAVETCTRAAGEIELRRAQGAVGFGQAILRLPVVMLAESKKARGVEG